MDVIVRRENGVVCEAPPDPVFREQDLCLSASCDTVCGLLRVFAWCTHVCDYIPWPRPPPPSPLYSIQLMAQLRAPFPVLRAAAAMEVGDGRPFAPPPPAGPGGAYPRDGPMVLLPHWPVGSRHPAAPRVLDGASKAATPSAAHDEPETTLIPSRPLVATPWVPSATLPRRASAPVWTAAGELLRPAGAAASRRGRGRGAAAARAAAAGGIVSEVNALAAAFVDARADREAADDAAADGRAAVAARVGAGIAAALPAVVDDANGRVRDGLAAVHRHAAAAHARAVAAAKADAAATVAAARADAEAVAAAARAAAADRVAARVAAAADAERRAADALAAARADAAAAAADADASRATAVGARLDAIAADARAAAVSDLGGRLATWTAPRESRVAALATRVEGLADAAIGALVATPAAGAATARVATSLAAAAADDGPVPPLAGDAAAGAGAGAGDDAPSALVGAVAASLPPAAAGVPLPTAAALRRRWTDGVAWPARVAVLLPAVGEALPAAAGGVVVRAAATLLAVVKPDFVDVGVAAPERALRRATTAVREGDLPAAIAATDDLSGLAREVVASWVADARCRLLVAQAARVLAAEAAVQASSSRAA